MAAALGGSALLWIALLLFSPDGTLMAPGKSKISLSPPWNRIFEGESVTLRCNQNNLGEDIPTKWFHRDTTFSTATSYLEIVNASFQNSGEYECQNQNLHRSNPVYLRVFKDWLLLQTSAEVVLEGESISLRCHGWKNWTVYKPIYYKDDQPFKYCYENHESITIANMNTEDSGTYHCNGSFRRKQKSQTERCSSEPLKITVMKAQQSKYSWLQLVTPLLVMILLVVDTGLFVSTEKQLKYLLMMKTTGKGNKLQNPVLCQAPKGTELTA